MRETTRWAHCRPATGAVRQHRGLGARDRAAPALAAGNVVVVKPSEYASASILEFANLIDQVGFPRGVVNVITGFGAEGPLDAQALRSAAAATPSSI